MQILLNKHIGGTITSDGRQDVSSSVAHYIRHRSHMQCLFIVKSHWHQLFLYLYLSGSSMRTFLLFLLHVPIFSQYIQALSSLWSPSIHYCPPNFSKGLLPLCSDISPSFQLLLTSFVYISLFLNVPATNPNFFSVFHAFVLEPYWGKRGGAVCPGV